MAGLYDTKRGSIPTVFERVRPIVKDVHVERQHNALKKSQELLHVLPTAEILGLTIDIDPDVFSPAFYSETRFFTGEVMKHIKPGERYLDLGCGAGTTAVCAAALMGAEVTAVDINPAAVANTQKNVNSYGLEGKIIVMQSACI